MNHKPREPVPIPFVVAHNRPQTRTSVVRCSLLPLTTLVANNKTRKLMLRPFRCPLIVFWNGQTTTTVPSTSPSLDPSRLIYAQLSRLVLSEN